MNILASLTNNFGKLSQKFDSFSFLNKILLCYILITVPFLYYHEKHLPLFAIILLISTTLLVTIVTFITSIQALKFLFKNEFNVFYEAIFLILSIWTIQAFGFLENQAGVIFLTVIILFFLFYRFFRLRVYYRIILIGISIFINGLMSFKYLQFSEIFLFNKSLESKYQNEVKDFTKWTMDDKTRILSNPDIPLKVKLPEEYHFFNPKDLKQNEKSGTGQIAGIITDSSNINSYPQIKIFYVEPLINIEVEILKQEFDNILNFEKSQGNMEEIKLLGENIYEKKKWKGVFWTFYDIIRPRYSKFGFYVFQLKDGSSIVLSITQNLVENQFHEDKIDEILESIQNN